MVEHNMYGPGYLADNDAALAAAYQAAAFGKPPAFPEKYNWDAGAAATYPQGEHPQGEYVIPRQEGFGWTGALVLFAERAAAEDPATELTIKENY